MDNIVQFLDEAIKEKQEELDCLKNARKELTGNTTPTRRRRISRKSNGNYRKPGQTIDELRAFAEKHEVFSPGDAGKEIGSSSYISGLLRKHPEIAVPASQAADGRVRLYRSMLFNEGENKPLYVGDK